MSLADTITKLSNARDAIVDALNSKGADMPSSATLYECADGISSLTIGANVTLGVVDSEGKFQAFSFSGTTPSDSGTAETVTDYYKSWNSTLPSPIDSLTAQLLSRSGTSFTVPAGITALGNYVLSYWAALTSVTLPSGLISMGAGLFTNCTGLTSVTIPDSVTTIYNSAFYNCNSLASVTLPASLTTLGNFAFTNCTSLTSIHIPAGVTSIGASAFSGCTNLTDIYCGFASGAVSGAPWGAPSATIHYAGE